MLHCFFYFRQVSQAPPLPSAPPSQGSLEKSSKLAAPNYSTLGTTAPAKYPSSHAKAPKDWEKVDSELSVGYCFLCAFVVLSFGGGGGGQAGMF